MDLDEIGQKLDRILELLGDGRPEVGGRNKYPWDELDADGRFLFPCVLKDRERVQASISAGANLRYGKGKVHVLKRPSGVLVIMRKSK